VATEGLTWTQLIIILVAATVPLVYAFTHHGRARENTLVVWLPFVLFVSRVVHPSLYGRPSPAWATASLEDRLRWATLALSMDPATIGWPLLVWLIFFLGRLRGRASGRKERESAEAMGRRAQRVEPIYLGIVVFLLIVMIVAARAADQADVGASSTQTAVVGTAAGEATWPQMIIVGLAGLAPPIYAFTRHGGDRIVSLVVWVPLWLFAAGVTYLAPSPRSNSLEGRLEWALNELLANPATIQWPLYVFFVFGLIRLFSGAPLSPASAYSAAPPPSSHGGEWCSHCGAPLRAEANFCARCGYDLAKQR
jgi:hypothetical protein